MTDTSPIADVSGFRVTLDSTILRAIVDSVLAPAKVGETLIEAECWSGEPPCSQTDEPRREWCPFCLAGALWDVLSADEEAYQEEMRNPANHEHSCGCGACRYAEEEAQREHERAHSAGALR